MEWFTNLIDWFKNLSEGWQTAIFVTAVSVGLAVIAGLFKLLFGKKKDPDLALEIIDNTLKENKQLRQTVKQLEEQLAKPSFETNIASQQSTPAPSAEAKELAKLINKDDGLYAQALKAITEGDNEKADELLDETQEFLDHVQQQKDIAQAKIYMARMQNASYAGRPMYALQYCDKLKPLAGEDSQILNEMAAVYYNNANYREAEPLTKRAIEIDQVSFGKDHPNVAIRLNNLAQLYKDTNRLAEAKPLMKRVVEILENPGGEPLPNYAVALNNLAQLYKATNRLAEAEPMMRRALTIFENSLGSGHPSTITIRKNLESLSQ